MFSLVLLISADALDWETYVQDRSAASAQELRRWLARESWQVALIWPDSSNRTIAVLAFAEFGAPSGVRQRLPRPREIDIFVGGRLSEPPFGRVVGVHVEEIEERGVLREAALWTWAAFPGPGGRCEDCGAEKPPHLPGCRYG